MIAKLIFFILLSITLLFFIITIYLLIRFKIKRNHKKAVYNILHAVAEEKDYLLLNNVTLNIKNKNSEPTLFDHILFGDKYIYLIDDYDKEGGLFGNMVDRYLLIKKGERTYKTNNPLFELKNKLTLLENELGIKHKDNLFLAMIVYNNALIVANNLKVKNNEQCFISLKELRDTILSAEKDQVQPLTHQATEELLQILKNNSDRFKEGLNGTSKKRR